MKTIIFACYKNHIRMSLLGTVCVVYAIFCLFCSVCIPCLRHTWKNLFEDELIDIFKDAAKIKNIFKKSGLLTIMSLIIAIIVVLLFLVMPFSIYWLHRSYKIDRKHKEEMVEFEKKCSEYVPEPPVKKEYLQSTQYIHVRKELPFYPDKGQIIFFETEYNAIINDYISKEYAKIDELFKYRGYKFVYLPMFIKKTLEHGNDKVKYTYPNLNDNNILSNLDVTTGSITKTILSYIDDPIHLGSGLICCKETTENDYVFSHFQFQVFDDIEMWEQFRAYISSVGDDRRLYSLAQPETPEDKADWEFSLSVQMLIDEIKEKIELLRQTGISEMVIKSLFKFDDTVKLSRLTVTEDYRIVLPDYNNMEITMTPLPKAVYFLFLKHPEGILFKHLPDYRAELAKIYAQLSNRENLAGMKRSVEDVTDPTKNAINEKCSRIREAFVRKFDETLAHNYFITGLRSTPKKIMLDRTLVIWGTGL